MLIIVPFYNCEQWLGRCLHSIADQQGSARVVLVDDCSTDDSYRIAQEYMSRYAARHHWTYVRNAVNKKCPYNIWWAMKEYGTEPEEPVLVVDGDDFLPHEWVLFNLLRVYAEPDTWLAYGQYSSQPFDPNCQRAQDYPIDISQGRSYRRWGNLFNHPLTWRTWLFHQIPVEQLQTPQGEWFRCCYDRALMWPLLELATEHDGRRHWKCLDDVLYVYNSENPLSEVHVLGESFYEAEMCVNYPVLEPACHP
jgi:glycosyltransferase involved in cell wall biosynthesis